MRVTPRLCINGIGLFVVWDEDRGLGTGSDIYAQSLTAIGGGPFLASTGVVVCNAAGSQVNPVVAPDGTGGVIVAWEDSRNSATTGHRSLRAADRRRRRDAVERERDRRLDAIDTAERSADRVPTARRRGGRVDGQSNRLQRHLRATVLSSGSASWTYNGVPVNDADWQQNLPSGCCRTAAGERVQSRSLDNHTPRYPV